MTINLEKVLESLKNWAFNSGSKIIIGFIILFIGWKLVNKLIKTMNNFLQKKNMDPTLLSFLDPIVNISLKAIVLLVVTEHVGLGVTWLAAILGSAGLAVGLALQGSLSNFAGGVIILVIRPFNVGDFIDAAGYSGAVEKIGIFYTNLLTIDNKVVLIPNGNLTNGSIINYTLKDQRRVDITVGVSYDANIKQVKEVLTNIIEKHPLILPEPTYFVGLIKHNASSVDFVIRVWANTDDYWTIYFDLMEEIKEKFDEENISIPYPQMDLHLKDVKNLIK